MTQIFDNSLSPVGLFWTKIKQAKALLNSRSYDTKKYLPVIKNINAKIEINGNQETGKQ